MNREEDRLFIEAIKLAAGSVQYKNISVENTMIKAVEQLYQYYDVGVKSTLHLILVLWQLNKAMF